MDWKKFCCFIGVGLLIIGSSLPALACGESNHDENNHEIKVQAPIDAIDCTAMTITVLGLTMDITNVSIDGEANDEHHEDGGNLTCVDLTVGQVVEVKLASDTGPLAATKVDVGGDCEDNVCDVKIAAPLQAIDLTAHTVTVLGLVVNISGATLQDENGQPITADQLAGGQFVELTLDSAQLPSLVATLLEVQNLTTGVYVEVIDEKGRPVNDGAVNDVQADVTVKHAKKILKFHTTSNGSFRLAGLPTGQAKIVVTRVHNGHKSKASGLVKVKDNSIRRLRIRLKQVH